MNPKPAGSAGWQYSDARMHSGIDQTEGQTGGGTPTVSIVLATFNGERYLGEQLESLRHQTQLPDELVVVDDASTDGTAAIIRDFARTAPFPINFIALSEHLGTCPTFEEGFRAAQGEVLVICDQDDRWQPEKIAVMAKRMADRPDALLAFSDAVLIDAGGSTDSAARVGGWPVSDRGSGNGWTTMRWARSSPVRSSRDAQRPSAGPWSRYSFPSRPVCIRRWAT